ncbi:MAG: shikimate dehydrogenase family protein [Chitinophagaceae bacterium]
MKCYGLIGYPLTHSFSKKYFTQKFKNLKVQDYSYQLFPLEDINNIYDLYIRSDIFGFNVTIPYKESILNYIEYVHEDIKKIGACNCVKILDYETYAYNTDVIGFAKSLLPLLKSPHKKALILGNGGASKAVQFVLERLGIEYKIVVRQYKNQPNIIAYEHCNEDIVAPYKMIINTTPLGMYPYTQEYPNIVYTAITKEHLLYDLIYNPEKTVFLQKGEQQGATIKNGYEMLILQAEESWRIWNNNNPYI